MSIDRRGFLAGIAAVSGCAAAGPQVAGGAMDGANSDMIVVNALGGLGDPNHPGVPGVSPRALAEAHASGLTAHLPFFRDHKGRAEYEHAIATMPLEYPPRSKSVYSDLGFILLGFILDFIEMLKEDYEIRVDSAPVYQGNRFTCIVGRSK